MEEKKKNNKGLVIVIILLVLIVLGLTGYICYDKGIIFNKNETASSKTESKKTNTTEESTTKEENLDINSRLVQYLYNLVTNDTNDSIWNNGWEFWYYDNDVQKKDFDINTASENVKMTLVGRNLKKSHSKSLVCDSNISDTVGNDYHSVCYYNKISNSYEFQYSYSRSYVESIYKELFGQNANLDTNIPINVFWREYGNYYYNRTFDSYVLYLIEAGGTGAGGEKYTLASAKKVDNKIIITQNVEFYTLDNPVENYKYIYTFETEDDGMYKFISRVKE